MVLELMFVRVFNILEHPADCTVFFQQYEFAYVQCRATQELLYPSPGASYLPHCSLRCSGVTVAEVTLAPGSEIPHGLNYFFLRIPLAYAFVGILCFLWFIVVPYGQEEGVGKRQRLHTGE